MTLHETLAGARARLVAAGISTAEASVDVDLFARTILGWDRARLLVGHYEPAPASLEPRLSEWLARREQHEPTAYIVGSREFWGLDFKVTSAVLIPRPESEFIVEEALAILSTMEVEHPKLADIGTGSGCLAVSLAHEVPKCTMVATDVSGTALAIARENAQRHGVYHRMIFVETTYLDGTSGEFDVIVSNPPYVKSGDKRALSADVKHEPDVALFGGEDGMRHVEAVLDTAVARVRHGGWFVMEFGFGQEDDVRERIAARPALRLDRIREDLQGIARTAVIQRT